MNLTTSQGEQHSAKCAGCGRRIWSAASIAAGRGSGCRAKLRAAVKLAATGDLGEFHDWQIAKASEAIEMRAVVHSSRPGLYAVTSSGGPVRKAAPEPVTVYLTDATEGSCTCKAAANGRRCYHLAAAVILSAAAGRRAA